MAAAHAWGVGAAEGGERAWSRADSCRIVVPRGRALVPLSDGPRDPELLVAAGSSPVSLGILRGERRTSAAHEGPPDKRARKHDEPPNRALAGPHSMILIILRRLLAQAVYDPPEAVRAGLLCLAVLAYGTTGFLYFELPENPDLTWLDAIWYAMVTVTTVGYGDLSPASLGGRYVVAVPLMFFGIGLLGYVLSLAASALVQAKQRELRGMDSKRLRDHLVIFNYPGVDKVVKIVDELRADSKFGYGSREIVLVDDTLDELPAELRARRVHFVRGLPARDDTLSRCSVDRAAYALVLTKRPADPNSDPLNVTITLAVEARAPSVVTVVECVDGAVEELLRKAGCDGIARPSRLDAHLLSQELLDPGSGDVIAQLTSNLSGQQFYITRLSGKLTRYGQVQHDCSARGHLSIGVRRGSEVKLNPTADYGIAEGDCVVTIGPARMAEFPS